MFRSRWSLISVVGGLALLLLALFTLPVFGQPPLNYSRTSPTVIGAVPFSDAQDTSEATQDFDDPYLSCSSFFGYPYASVWFSYQPASAQTLTASTTGSSYTTVIAAFDQWGNLLGCAADGGSLTFAANAFEPYEIMVGAQYGGGYPGTGGGGGLLEFQLDQVTPPANDSFADATPFSTLPFTADVELQSAGNEAGEPRASCAYTGLHGTVWYAYTPVEDGSLSVWMGQAWFDTFLAAYSGSSLADLSELGCRNYYFGGEYLTIEVAAGSTVYFQVGNMFATQIGPITFNADVPPPPQAGFYYWPNPPSQFDEVQLSASGSYDPAGVGIESYSWDLGDGSTAEGFSVQKRYDADGAYEVLLTVTTFDGRSASASQIVNVETHDVAITRFQTPNAASVGQTRNISVGVANARYGETVTVYLYRSTPYGFEYVGGLTQEVPVRSGNRTTNFDFSYTFTEDDAVLGSVTFRAEAWINGHSDALPANNEAIASPTKLNP